MIQRIQTLYLFLASLAMGLMLALPLAHLIGGVEEMTLTALGFEAPTPEGGVAMVLRTLGMTIVVNAACGLPLVNIFLFKRRQLQFRLCATELVLVAGAAVFAAWYVWHGVGMLEGFGISAWKLGFGVVMPLVAALFTWLAMRAIRRDIYLVKSLDRIR